MTFRITSTLATTFAAIAAAGVLAACDQAPVTQISFDLEAPASEASELPAAPVVNLPHWLAGTLKDASITAAVTGEIARDPSLSALRIDVDTDAGRVALHGSAPDRAARDRATRLAQRVGGVTAVNNQLTIRRQG